MRKKKNRAKFEECWMAYRAANALNCLSSSGTLHWGWKRQSKPIVRWHIRVLHIRHVFIPLCLPEWLQWRQKGIAATEAAVVFVSTGSPLTVPQNGCEKLCRRSFSKTARVFFRAAIATMLFTKRTIFRIFEESTWDLTLRPSGSWHCSLSWSLRPQSAWNWYTRWNTQLLTSPKSDCGSFFFLPPAVHQRWLTPLLTSVLTQHA